MEKGFLQAQAELSRQDDSAARNRRFTPTQYQDNNNNSSSSNSNRVPSPPVPLLKEKYDPSHPDADWGGYVQRSYKKKVYTDHVAARDNLTVDSQGGLMPDTSAGVSGATFSGKKMFDPEHAPSGDPSVPGIQFQSAVYQLGPGSDLSCRDWKTSSAAQNALETTPKDVYALGTRQNTQHRRHVTPMYDKSNQDRRDSGGPARDNNSMHSHPSSRGSSPIPGLVASGSSGSLSGRRGDSRKSMLAGIGMAIAVDDSTDSFTRPEHHLIQSYADPMRKNLLTENHHRITLGYTGRKPSFQR